MTEGFETIAGQNDLSMVGTMTTTADETGIGSDAGRETDTPMAG